MVLRLIEQTAAMFHQSAQGHAATNLHSLRHMAGLFQQYQTVNVHNIDDRALTNQVLAITGIRQVNVKTPIQNVMNTLTFQT